MIDRIDHIVMNCRDVEATASWYERALGFEREVYQKSSGTGTADRAEVRAAEVQFATDRQPRLGDLQGRCTGLA